MVIESEEPFENHRDPDRRQRHPSMGIDDRMTRAERLARMILARQFDDNLGGHRLTAMAGGSDETVSKLGASRRPLKI